jgi:hypothetical protein
MDTSIRTLIFLLPLASIIPLSALSYRLIQHETKAKKIAKIHEYINNAKAISPVTKFNMEMLDNRTSNDYIIPVILATITVTAGIYVTFMIGDQGDIPFLMGHHFGDSLKLPDSTKISLMAVAWSFMGSFTFGLHSIFRRYVSFDLFPRVYYDIVIRTVYAISIALAIRFLAEDIAKTVAAPALFFVIGSFPERGLLFIEHHLSQIPGFSKKDAEPATNYPLSMVEGLSLMHRTRLKELGIDNVQNLAVFDYTDLLVRTPFNPETLTSWIGAAKLILIFGNDVKKLHKIGINDIFSFKMAYENKDIGADELSRLTSIEKKHINIAYNQITTDTFFDIAQRFSPVIQQKAHQTC